MNGVDFLCKDFFALRKRNIRSANPFTLICSKVISQLNLKVNYLKMEKMDLSLSCIDTANYSIQKEWSVIGAKKTLLKIVRLLDLRKSSSLNRSPSEKHPGDFSMYLIKMKHCGMKYAQSKQEHGCCSECPSWWFSSPLEIQHHSRIALTYL